MNPELKPLTVRKLIPRLAELAELLYDDDELGSIADRFQISRVDAAKVLLHLSALRKFLGNVEQQFDIASKYVVEKNSELYEKLGE